MRKRVLQNAFALTVTVAAGISPAVAFPPVEQRSAAAERSQVLDPTDYGPGSYSSPASSSGSGSNIYGGGASSGTYTSGSRAPVASGGSKSASGGNQWETYNQLQQLQEEVQQLRGMIEQQKFEIEQLRKQQKDRYLDIDARLSRMGSGGAAPVAATQPSSDASGETSSAAAPTGDQKSAYSAALENVKAKRFTAAISQLEGLLSESPQGQLAPNCHYWLGELYMVNDPADYDKAKAHFQQLLKNHSDHAKVPDALYKLGKLSALKGDRERAKVYLDRVIQDFPDSQATVLAKDYLKRL